MSVCPSGFPERELSAQWVFWVFSLSFCSMVYFGCVRICNSPFVVVVVVVCVAAVGFVSSPSRLFSWCLEISVLVYLLSVICAIVVVFRSVIV